MRLEETIIRELISNEDYSKKVLPYLKSDYFSDAKEKLIFDEVKEFILKYNTLPKYESIIIELDNSTRLNDEQIKQCKELLTNIRDREANKSNIDWLIDSTEKFCQEKAIYNAMMESLEIMKDPKKGAKGMIPQLLSDALAISFDPDVGHDYLGDYEKRYEHYHQVHNRIPFDLEILNKVTGGGLPDKTFTVLLAGINVGKTLTMCHMAAANLAAGHDVLYITMEMAEEEISKRIDANLLNVDIDVLMEIPKSSYIEKVTKLKNKTDGTLIVKEYPTAGASALTFKGLLNELYLKKNFRPKIIYIDYVNICASSRIRMGGSVNTYSYIKSVAEELRGLAVEFKVPIVTATQVTRAGFGATDLDMTDTAESFGLPATADFMLALVTSKELEALNQLLMIQVKSRLGDKNKMRTFTVGIDRPKFKLYDIEQEAQTELMSNAKQPEPFIKEDRKEKMRDFKW